MMPFGKKACFWILSLLPLALSASDYTVRIEGTAKGAEGREIVWKADADAFSGLSVELDRCRIDDTGGFVLQTDLIGNVLPTYLVIDYYSTGFFARAGKEYRMEMASFDYHLDEKCNAFIPFDDIPSLRYTLADATGKSDTADLNALVGRYSALYRRMVVPNFEQINIRKNTAPVEAFIRMADSLFAGVEDAFFADYRRYTEAELKDFAGMLSRKELYHEYMEDKAVDVSNPACVAFLKTYYTDYFKTGRFLPFVQVARILNRKDFTPARRYAALADSMGLDYSLRGERLREWVLIHACSEVMGDEAIDKGKMLDMLRFLQGSTKFKEHAKAIVNMLRVDEEKRLRPYFKNICLKDSAENEVPVERLLEKDRFHYFVFVRAGYERCPSCAEEAAFLKKIWSGAKEQVRDAVKIIFVNCDYPFAAYYHDAMYRRYPWPYLHFNGNIEWIRQIDAARFPAFLLVDDKGNVLNSSFNAPSQNIQSVFERMAKLRAARIQAESGSTE